MAKKSKKRWNKKLLITLLVVGVLLTVVFLVALDSKYPCLPYWAHKILGRDPAVLEAKAKDLVAQARAQQEQNKKQVAGIKDPAEKFNKLRELNKDTSDPLWESAFRMFSKASKYEPKDDIAGRVAILTEISDMLLELRDYTGARRYWNAIMQLDPSNMVTAHKIVNFAYDVAKDTNQVSVWSSVLDMLDRTKPLPNPVSIIMTDKEDISGQVMLAHAKVALLGLGATKDAAKDRKDSEAAVREILKQDDKNITAYRLLAELALWDINNRKEPPKAVAADRPEELVLLESGDQELTGVQNSDRILRLKQACYTKVKDFLQQAIEKNPQATEPCLNMIELYYTNLINEALQIIQIKQSAIQRLLQQRKGAIGEELTEEEAVKRWRAGKNKGAGGGNDFYLNSIGKLHESKMAKKAELNGFIDRFLGKVDEWIGRFPQQQRGELYYAKVLLLQKKNKDDLSNINEYIKLTKQALECKPKEEPKWYGTLANLYILKRENTDDYPEGYKQAYEALEYALYLPAAMVVELQGRHPNKVSTARYGYIIPLMIDTCAALSKDEPARKKKYLETAHSLLKELSERLTQENFYVKVAEGTIDLAEGRREEGITKLYNADSLGKLQGIVGLASVRLNWKLYQVLRETNHKTLAAQYGAKVIHLYPAREQVKYMQLISEMPSRYFKQLILKLANSFQEKFGRETPYQQQILALVTKDQMELGQWAEAEKSAAELKGDSVEIKWLKAQAKADVQKRVASIEQFVQAHPAYPAAVSFLYNYYLLQYSRGEQAVLGKVRSVIEAALKADPSNLDFHRYLAVLKEPDPLQITPERLREITLEAVASMSDPVEKACKYGEVYQQAAQEAASRADKKSSNKYLQDALKYYTQAAQGKPDDMDIRSQQFLILLDLQDWSKAEDMLMTIDKIDSTQRLYYEALLNIARQQYPEAASLLSSYLDKRPLSTEAHLALANVYIKMGRDDDALNEVKVARAQDFYNVPANRMMVSMLHERYLKIGLDKLSPDQIIEINGPLDRILDVSGRDNMAHRLKITYTLLFLKHLGKRLSGLTPSEANKQQRAELQVEIQQLQRSIIARCKYLVSRNPHDIGDWNRYANALIKIAELSNDPKIEQENLLQAEKVYQQGIKLNPDSVELVTALGILHNRRGASGGIEKELQAMITRSEGATKNKARKQLASVLSSRGRFSEAEVLLLQVCKDDAKDYDALIQLGELYSKWRKFAEAEDVFSRLLKAPDANLTKQGKEYLFMRRVEVMLAAGEIQKADKWLAEMKRAYPDSTTTMLVVAEAALNKADYVAAISAAEQVIAKGPQKIANAARRIKAQALFFSEHLSEAADEIQQLIRSNPADSIALHLQLAQVYWRMSNFDRAINELQILVNSQKVDRRTRTLFIGMLKIRQRWSELDQFYNKLLKDNPDNVEYRIEAVKNKLQRGDTLLQKNQKSQAQIHYRNALEIARQAWKLSQKTGQEKQAALQNLLRCLLLVGRYQEAADVAATGIKDSDESGKIMLLLYQAEAAYHLRQYDDALTFFEKALNKVADKPQTANYILSQIYRVGTPDNVLAWCKKRLQQQPDWDAIYLVMARIYQDKGDSAKSVELLKKASEQAKGKVKFIARQQLMLVYLRQEQWATAIELGRKLIKDHPDDPQVANNLAYALMGSGSKQDYEEAVEMAEKAHNLNPLDTDIMDTYGMALIESGKYQEAERILKRAIQNTQRDRTIVPPEYEYHLAQALMGRKLYDEARRRLEQALKQNEQISTFAQSSWNDKIKQLLLKIPQK